MANTWILVAQGSSGKLLDVAKNGKEISLIKEFLHPETAAKGREIYSDRPGRSFESAGPTRHAMAYPTEFHDRARRAFALEIANFLKKAHAENQFAELILVASPDLLGELRNAMADSLTKAVSHQLDKDLLSQNLSDAELIEKIRNDLGIVVF